MHVTNESQSEPQDPISDRYLPLRLEFAKRDLFGSDSSKESNKNKQKKKKKKTIKKKPEKHSTYLDFFNKKHDKIVKEVSKELSNTEREHRNIEL